MRKALIMRTPDVVPADRDLSAPEEPSLPLCMKALEQEAPDALAIAVPKGVPIMRVGLWESVRYFIRTLNNIGVGRKDRVAVVLPNGPETVIALAGVMSCATAAPLNPNYSYKEFEFHLSDLNAKALLLPSGLESPAREIARQRGIGVLELTTRNEKKSVGLAARPEITIMNDNGNLLVSGRIGEIVIRCCAVQRR